MPHILTTLVPIIIVAALLQILLFALPLLYFRWHYMLNSLESFLAISLILTTIFILHPLALTLLITSTIAPPLLAYRASLFARARAAAAACVPTANQASLAPLTRGVKSWGEAAWAAVGVLGVWTLLGKGVAVVVAAWVVKRGLEGEGKGEEGERRGARVGRTDVAVRE